MRLLLSTALACLLLFGCTKYDEDSAFSLRSPKKRLTGEWDVVKINDTIPEGFSYQTWEFEKDGDFKFSTIWEIFQVEIPENLVGEWEFENNKEEIDISLDSMSLLVNAELIQLPSAYIPSGEFEIIRLTCHELWLEIGNDRIELERID
jgi:hypothetical protein